MFTQTANFIRFTSLNAINFVFLFITKALAHIDIDCNSYVYRQIKEETICHKLVYKSSSNNINLVFVYIEEGNSRRLLFISLHISM